MLLSQGMAKESLIFLFEYFYGLYIEISDGIKGKFILI